MGGDDGEGAGGRDWRDDPEPLVSVVLPTFDRAATLPRALASVLEQDHRRIEVLVVDDGSTDDTHAVVARFADPRIRLLVTPAREGAPAARNRGIAAATGALVAFQDSDDRWLATKLSAQIAALRAMPQARLCYCALLQCYDRFRAVVPGPRIRHVAGDVLPSLVRDSFVSTQTMLVERAALLDIGGFDPALPRLQDWDLALRLAQRGPFAFVPDALAIAHETPGNLTADAMKGVAARAILLAKHADLYRDHPAAAAHGQFVMASLCRRHGRIAEARRHLAHALALAPLSPRYRWLQLRLGWAAPA